MHLDESVIRELNTYELLMNLYDFYDPSETLKRHSVKAAYIMLEIQKRTEKYTLQELRLGVSLALTHDIGGLYVSNKVDLDSVDVFNHSVYSYLLFKYLMNMGVFSESLLYHHLDYKHLKNLDGLYSKELISILRIADVYSYYSLDEIKQYSGDRYDPYAVKLIEDIDKDVRVQENLSSGKYMDEVNKLFEHSVMSSLQIKSLMRSFVYPLEKKYHNLPLLCSYVAVLNWILGTICGIDNSEKSCLYFYGALFKILYCKRENINGLTSKYIIELIEDVSNQNFKNKSVKICFVSEKVAEELLKHKKLSSKLVKSLFQSICEEYSLTDVYALVKGNIDFIEKEMESIQDAVYFVQDNLQKEHDVLLETLNNKYLREKNK